MKITKATPEEKKMHITITDSEGNIKLDEDFISILGSIILSEEEQPDGSIEQVGRNIMEGSLPELISHFKRMGEHLQSAVDPFMDAVKKDLKEKREAKA